MNDVLPKPFTKEGMLKNLEKHLDALKKVPLLAGNHAAIAPVGPPSGFNPATGAPLGLNMNHIASSVKDENSPGKSPAGSWHSPSNQLGASPQSVGYGHPMSAGVGFMTPTHGGM
jgi:osomolarity two-component system response regulator SKN7